MNKKGQIGIGGIVLMFIGIIVAVALLSPIFASQNVMTDKQSTTNQSIDVSSAYLSASEVNESVVFTVYSQSTWKQAECPLTSVVLRNIGGDTLTITTDYVLDADAGTFTLVDTAATQDSNITYVDYTYCEDGYNTGAGSRSIANLIGLFAILAIVFFVLAKSGIVNFRM